MIIFTSTRKSFFRSVDVYIREHNSTHTGKPLDPPHSTVRSVLVVHCVLHASLFCVVRFIRLSTSNHSWSLFIFIIAGVLSLNPAPENTKTKDGVYPNMPIDPNYIFGSVQTTKSPYFSNYPQPGAGSPAVFQPMYPPLNQPPPGAQLPIAFGASPQNPYYPRPQNPATSTEPSLWNQFLYNKQPDKRPRNAAPRLTASSSSLILLLTACPLVIGILRRMAPLAGSSSLWL